MLKLTDKIKAIWNELPFTSRHDIKWSVAGAGLIAAGITVATIPMVAAIGTSLATFGIAYAATAILGVNIPKRIREIREGKDTVQWTNAIGQTIESTRTQQKDLEHFAEKIKLTADSRSSIGRHSTKMASFNTVANDPTVVVVNDIEGGNGIFRFHPPRSGSITIRVQKTVSF